MRGSEFEQSERGGREGVLGSFVVRASLISSSCHLSLPFSLVMQHISIRVLPSPELEIKISLCLGRCGRLSFGKHARSFTTIRSRG